MATLLTCLLVFLSNDPQHVWHLGSLVLEDGTVVVGKIALASEDVLLADTRDGLAVLPARRVTSFRYFDSHNRINRSYQSHRLPQSLGRVAFYEVVANGGLTVLRKQMRFSESIDETMPDSFRYYISDGTTLVPIKNFRGTFYDVVRRSLEGQSGVDRLDPNDTADIIRLIQLFNQTRRAVSIAGI